MRLETLGQQSTLTGEVKRIGRNVFDRPIEELRAMVEDAQVECYECGARGRVGKRMLAVEVYNEPWQEEPTTIHVCREVFGPEADGFTNYGQSCLDLLEDTGWADFRYFYCDGCGRMVARQCHSNGWHSYVRIVNECEEVCLKCYEEGVFEDGLPREEFAAGRIPGMFCDKAELEAHGFEPVEDWQDCHIESEAGVDAFCATALDRIDHGFKVAVDYESMAIGGLEGYVSLYAKKGED